MANFIWYDVATCDADATQAFYSSVIGWRTDDAGLSNRRYSVFSANSVAVAGLAPTATGGSAKASWMGYIGVDNVDLAIDDVYAAGGKLQRGPEDIPNVGRIAVIRDPQGADFLLFHSADAQQNAANLSVTMREPGFVGWHELRCENHALAFAFYAQLFGWVMGKAFDLGEMGVYQTFHVNGAMIGGMLSDKNNASWIFSFTVTDFAAAIERVTINGGTVMNVSRELPDGLSITYCTDPQGGMFGVLRMPQQ